MLPFGKVADPLFGLPRSNRPPGVTIGFLCRRSCPRGGVAESALPAPPFSRPIRLAVHSASQAATGRQLSGAMVRRQIPSFFMSGAPRDGATAKRTVPRGRMDKAARCQVVPATASGARTLVRGERYYRFFMHGPVADGRVETWCERVGLDLLRPGHIPPGSMLRLRPRRSVCNCPA